MLPKLITPEHEVKLFSQKKSTKFRPYLVKEEKLFLMAQQSGEKKDIENTVRQVVRNCTFDALNVDSLPSFDLEYLFLQLRARSVSNLVEVSFICNKEEDGKKCGTLVPLGVNLDDVKLVVPEEHTDTYQLTDDIGVVMQYPTAAILDPLGPEPDVTALLAACIKQVFTKTGDVMECTSEIQKETLEFVETWTLSQTEKVRKFFDTMPHLEHTLDFKCPKCGYEEQLTLTGLLDFFD